MGATHKRTRRIRAAVQSYLRQHDPECHGVSVHTVVAAVPECRDVGGRRASADPIRPARNLSALAARSSQFRIPRPGMIALARRPAASSTSPALHVQAGLADAPSPIEAELQMIAERAPSPSPSPSPLKMAEMADPWLALVEHAEAAGRHAARIGLTAAQAALVCGAFMSCGHATAVKVRR